MSSVIKIENLYKEYRLGVIGRGTLYRDIQSAWAKFRNKEDPNSIIGREEDSNSLKNKSFLVYFCGALVFIFLTYSHFGQTNSLFFFFSNASQVGQNSIYFPFN